MTNLKTLLIGASIMLLASSQSFAQGTSISADDFLKNKPATANSADANAQPAVKAELSELEKNLAEAKAELDNPEILAKKIDLAKKMHQIRPTRDQVDMAVKRASLSFPRSEQQNFINAMDSMLNYNAIERISIDAMIETFTLKEIDSMVEYYSRPEAKSASKKIGSWAKSVQPEVANMIDKAMMRIRTGQ